MESMSEYATEGVMHRDSDRVGVDAVSVKPSEISIDRVVDRPVDRLVIDWEGRDHLPDRETLAALAETAHVRVTVPVRADGFDPLGDDSLYDQIPETVDFAFVAGHPAYLSPDERRRAVAPRFGTSLDRFPDAWVGTEGVTEVALATGATQFDLLVSGTERRLRALRSAGFEGGIAIYAPTVLSEDADAVLDAVGDYVARRGAVAERLPGECATDSSADPSVREVLLEAAEEYALVGDPETVRSRIASLRSAGADHVVSYPARGIDGLVADPDGATPEPVEDD